MTGSYGRSSQTPPHTIHACDHTKQPMLSVKVGVKRAAGQPEGGSLVALEFIHEGELIWWSADDVEGAHDLAREGLFAAEDQRGLQMGAASQGPPAFSCTGGLYDCKIRHSCDGEGSGRDAAPHATHLGAGQDTGRCRAPAGWRASSLQPLHAVVAISSLRTKAGTGGARPGLPLREAGSTPSRQPPHLAAPQLTLPHLHTPPTGNCWYDTPTRIIAKRSILPGEDLTCDNALAEAEDSLHAGTACMCGSAACRAALMRDNCTRWGRRWVGCCRGVWGVGVGAGER